MLRLVNLEAGYGPLRVLKGVSLHVSPGEAVAIIGANGAGKTTLLKTIAGILKPRSGKILFDKEAIHGAPPEQIVRLGCSLVPEGRHVFPTMTVKENLILGAYSRRQKRGAASDLAAGLEEVYKLFGILAARRNQLAGTLSGGEQQMLAIGRALMSRPKLLMLDEPSLGLSPLLTKEIFNIIQDINRKDGVTILLVEQNVNMALQYANYAFLMENGRIVRADRPEVLREDPDVKEFYLGIATETSVKGYKRYRRKVRFR